MAGKAKVLKDKQIKTALAYLLQTRQPKRNRVMFLLSCKAGLRAMEISKVTWLMVVDSERNIADEIDLHKSATKGKKGGRIIPLAKILKEALQDMDVPEDLNKTIVQSERKAPMSAQTVTNWFYKLYEDLGFVGCSSHSGRRTVGTNAAYKIIQAGGTLKDVQKLLGHKSLNSTQHYIDGNESAMRKVIELI